MWSYTHFLAIGFPAVPSKIYIAVTTDSKTCQGQASSEGGPRTGEGWSSRENGNKCCGKLHGDGVAIMTIWVEFDLFFLRVQPESSRRGREGVKASWVRVVEKSRENDRESRWQVRSFMFHYKNVTFYCITHDVWVQSILQGIHTYA